MEEEKLLFDDYNYQYVDGYKHRKLLTEIGWDYNIEEGYYTTLDGVVVVATDRLEECLWYKNNGVPNLMDYLIGEIDGRAYLAPYVGTKVFDYMYKGIQRLFEDIPINHIEDIYTYKKMVNDVESGRFGYIVEHVEEQKNALLGFIGEISDKVGDD